MRSTSFVRMFGVALLVAAGCGSNSPAGVSGTAGKGGTSAGGTTTSGSGGTSRQRDGGDLGNGGTTTSGRWRDDGERQRRDDGERDGRRHRQRRNRRHQGRQPPVRDGIDNDGDGKATASTPSASGPTTTTKARSRPASPAITCDACKQDCFFDGNSGRATTLLVAAQVRPAGVAGEVRLRPELRARSTRRVLAVGVAAQTLPRQLPQAGPERLRLLRLLRDPRRADADPPRGDLHGGQRRRPGEVPALHAGDPVRQPLRPLRDLHRQADAARRLHHHDAGRRDRRPAPAAQQLRQRLVSCGPGTPTPADGWGPNYGCITGCCIPTSIWQNGQDFSEAHPAAAGRRAFRVRSRCTVRPGNPAEHACHRR